MRRMLSIFICSFALLGIQPASAETNSNFTVMSRNIYLGADVGVAMELLPDFPAATQFMWDQMRQTDFASRSSLLAQEIIESNPDVIGIQEATQWYCQKGPFSDQVVIYDFIYILLEDLKQQGYEYEIASLNGKTAKNVGFEIAPIPFLTEANDPELFLSIFGSNSAYCGFEIADVLLIKKSISENLLAVGTAEYKEKYTIIPTIMSIYRGYSWADISINGKPVRFVTTHLESSFAPTEIPVAKVQVDQLMSDLAQTKIPIILLGDFNSDPRDPRPLGALNPGGQPTENEKCVPQISNPTKQTAISSCNAYWTVVQNGFIDTGPDPLDPKNYTWGMDALLTGPEQTRLTAALQLGNETGFTDRLDFVFIKGPIESLSAQLVGNTQTTNWASDHAGLVANLTVLEMVDYNEVALAENNRFPIGFWPGFLLGLVVVAFLIVYRKRKN